MLPDFYFRIIVGLGYLFLKRSHIIDERPPFICIWYLLLKIRHIVPTLRCFIKKRAICLRLKICC